MSTIPLSIRLLTTILFLIFSPLTSAIPTPQPNHRTCRNHLANPSFESGALDPWLPIVSSAWSDRGVIASEFTHSGSHVYHAHATSTVASSLALSQSGINISVGGVVDCYAWVAGRRSEGVMSIEVFLDGVSCGAGEVGVGEEGWKRVGSRVLVKGGEGAGSTVAVVASSERAGEEGWEVWIDDVGVVGC